MLWHHNARVNSHQRWKQTRFRVCFHLWCEWPVQWMWRDDKFNGIHAKGSGRNWAWLRVNHCPVHFHCGWLAGQFGAVQSVVRCGLMAQMPWLMAQVSRIKKPFWSKLNLSVHSCSPHSATITQIELSAIYHFWFFSLHSFTGLPCNLNLILIWPIWCIYSKST